MDNQNTENLSGSENIDFPKPHKATHSEDDPNEPEFEDLAPPIKLPEEPPVPTNDGEKAQAAKAERKAKAVGNKIAKEKAELENLLATSILNNEVTLNKAIKIAHDACLVEARTRIKNLSQSGREDLKKKLTGK
tara:strand:+ start:3097 stop:3498 length:402 start_codon:yes stop_codon:yes gene_type:complete